MYYPHDFHRVGSELYCEGVSVRCIAEAVGTPVYIYSHKTLVDHLRKLQAAFRKVRALICFSVKANGNLAILRLLVRHGAGLDIVSSGELYKAQRVGCPVRKIVFASVGKRADEIRLALRSRILCFNVESLEELETIDAIARRMRRIAPVALRLNPNVDARTHRHLTTGLAESKFGIDLRAARRILREHKKLPGVSIIGVHLHIGSQISTARPFVQAIRRAASTIKEARRSGVPLEWLNIGGGLGIVYKDERPQTPKQFAAAVLPLIIPLRLRLILEPGRFIAGNAGVLTTEVLYVKRGERKHFAVVDAGMNDLIRPALYGAHHEIMPVIEPRGCRDSRARYDVVGPVCESADVFARNRRLAGLKPGFLLALLGAGAYGSVMASNYNGRARPAEVLVRERRWFLIRRRETMRDLVRLDVLPREPRT